MGGCWMEGEDLGAGRHYTTEKYNSIAAVKVGVSNSVSASAALFGG